MNKSFRVVASVTFNENRVTAEYDRSSGRLRIFDNDEVKTEWFPPHSWFALATVAGSRMWGTNPSEEDLRMFIEDFAGKCID
ncbi:hypothetical protein AAGS40_18280 [Paraburkholderia sp. PREW-6R]|uniref:hypothetical protein n=1 Tax=Paraburkholderia sp. PREW-6R TaxID=3141544 RepID=UPI0031F52AC0